MSNYFNPMYASPYASSTGFGSNDFMTAATYNPVSQAALLQGYQQPAQDQFVSSQSGSSGLVSGLKLAAVTGGGTAAGLWFFGGDKVSPFKDGKFTDDFLRTLEDSTQIEKYVDDMKINKVTNVFNTNNITDIHQYDAIKQFAQTGKGPASVTLPAGLTQEQAKTLIQNVDAEIAKINPEQIRQQVINTKTLEGSTAELARLNGIKSKLTALPETIGVDDLAKHIKENASAYGIKAEGEALETAARQMATQGRASLIAANETLITSQTNTVNSIRGNLTAKVSTYWDDATKSLKAGAPENIVNAVKNFKWKTVGKWGAIAAGVGLAVGWLFGRNKA